MNIGPYHGRGRELIEDLKKFCPDFLMLAWCESRHSDVTLLLRREGFFSYMVLRHDLQIITGNPGARPSQLQMKILTEIGNLHDNYKNIPKIRGYFQLRVVWRPACLCTGVRGLGRL